jgi:hypothetical protein
MINTPTQGPWKAVGAKIYAPDCEHHPVADCSTNHTCRDEWEVEANAVLMAAAPDLLEALRQLLTSDDYPQAERMAYAAIEKTICVFKP